MKEEIKIQNNMRKSNDLIGRFLSHFSLDIEITTLEIWLLRIWLWGITIWFITKIF